MAPPHATAATSPREMLARLVAFDTTSRNSNRALIDFIAGYLAEHGIKSHLSHNEDGSKANLWATIGPQVEGGVVLSGHTDVVPVDGQDWTTDPFGLDEREGRLYGRGSADMKGFIATALALVPALVAARMRRPVHLALSFDEEVGCLGVHAMLRQIAVEMPRPALAIIGEPTEMRVANAHKGIGDFFTEVRGREAHSSATHVGVSAIIVAARLIGFLDRLAEEFAARRPAGPREADFEPPYTTINVGTIEGGSAVNIIPRSCRFAWDCRPLPGVDPLEIRARLDEYAETTLLPLMRARDPDGAIVTTTGVVVPPLTPEADSPAEALALALTGANRSVAVSFASEAGLFQQAGIPAVLCGPGSVREAHRPDEFVSLEQLTACETFIRRLGDHLARP